MNSRVLNLEELISKGSVNTISGRAFGESFARNNKVVEGLKAGDNFIIKINEENIKAINDSFIKGFYSSIFEILRSKSKVNSRIELDANEYYKQLFDKNLTILDAIFNS